MTAPAATVSIVMGAARSKTFEYVVPIDLPSIFTGYGPLPAVKGTKDETGGWDGAGQSRTIILADDSTAREQLTRYEAPEYFSYVVSDFTGPFRLLVASANGEWWFEEKGPKRTRVSWRYAFNPRSPLVLPVLWFMTRFLWRDYMAQALSLAKQKLEAEVA